MLNTLAGEALQRGEVEASTKLFLAAARLADASRQQELTAVALAERESMANEETDEERLTRERLETARALAAKPNDD